MSDKVTQRPLHEEEAIDNFSFDMQNSVIDTDIKESIERLAAIIGSKEANKISSLYGFKNSYYKM